MTVVAALCPSEAGVPHSSRHVEHCMGTVFSIDIRDPGDWTGAVQRVVDWLHRVDDIFSTYRSDSDISRIRRSQLAVRDADPLVAEVLERCGRMHFTTNGYFSAMYAGAVDPTGLVKGWAIENASGLLRQAGSVNHAIGGGGDVQLAGEPATGQLWRIGIADPRDPRKVLAVVTGRDLAIATSGTSERGEHIINPFTGRSANDLLGVSVIGPSLTTADCYATAAFAMGAAHALDWLEAHGHEGLAVTAAGRVTATNGFDRYRSPA